MSEGRTSTVLGVLSDTHGFLDPRVFDVFDGVDHILHAGDLGSEDEMGFTAPAREINRTKGW